MMSPDNNPTLKTPPGKESSSTGKKTNSSSKPTVLSQVINCPRCDSPNTKFCYYNNYSLSQPRHFCKTCRRYWTNGGALRNVPIGGGCRKNKKMNKPSASNSRVSIGDIHLNDSSVSSAHQTGGLKFFQGISPAIDFQLGGLNNFPGLHQSPHSTSTGLFMSNHFSYYNEGLSNTCGPAISSSGFTLEPLGNISSNTFMGLSSFPLFAHKFQEMGSSSSFNSSPNLASSIESLSSINQNLHWKLQQQRLAMLYVGDDNNEKENNANTTHHNSSSGNVESLIAHKPQPILFQNLETDDHQTCGIDTILSSRKDSGECGTLATEWFFDNSMNPKPSTTSGSNVVNNETNPSNWNSGFQAWSDLSHFTALP